MLVAAEGPAAGGAWCGDPGLGKRPRAPPGWLQERRPVVHDAAPAATLPAGLARPVGVW